MISQARRRAVAIDTVTVGYNQTGDAMAVTTDAQEFRFGYYLVR